VFAGGKHPLRQSYGLVCKKSTGQRKLPLEAAGVAWSHEQVAAAAATNACAQASGSIFQIYAALNHSPATNRVKTSWNTCGRGLGCSGPQGWTNNQFRSLAAPSGSTSSTTWA
jgi:hypothetical protein